jgi:hypothetical protein
VTRECDPDAAAQAPVVGAAVLESDDQELDRLARECGCLQKESDIEAH